MLERFKSFRKKGMLGTLASLPQLAISFVVAAATLAVGSAVLYGISPLGTGVDTCNVTLGGTCTNNVSYTIRQANQGISAISYQLPLLGIVTIMTLVILFVLRGLGRME